MLVLSRHDVEQLLTMPDAIAAVAEGLCQLTLGHVTMPQRLAVPVAMHNGIHLSMPAFVEGEPGALAIKIVTVYNDNPARYGEPTIQGVVLVHDPRTGKPLALMDAEHLTAMRTGAISGVATQTLARADARTVMLFGAGAQAGPQLEAVCTVRPIERAFVFALNPDGGRGFCARMAEKLGIPVEPLTDVQQGVEMADVVCTATNASSPLFNGDWLRPGTHINAIGAYTRTMRELDTTTILRSRVYVDGRTAAQTEAGDIVIPVQEGAITYDHVVGELGEVLLGLAPGRMNDADITLFKTVGMAVQDAVTAPLVLQRARERGMGQEVKLT
ncbi:MAG: ornithine cyclodeaminase family protein [Anaerolineales bacterium]|nr:ornithine cyclodeaminase family protein [Anaerolineales bacterium]